MLTGKGIKHIFRKRISQIPRRSGVRLIARGNKQKGSEYHAGEEKYLNV